MIEFLSQIKKKDLYNQLTNWEEWKKISPVKNGTKKEKISVAEFRKNNWIKGGIFGDFIKDDLNVYPLPAKGEGRIYIPHWNSDNCVDCKICLNNCPENAIETKEKVYKSIDDKCIGCGICEAVCPRKCWNMSFERKEIS